MELPIMQYSQAPCHFIHLRSKQSPQQLFSNTLNLCFTLKGEINIHTTRNSLEDEISRAAK
jgi:hypothetical protein